MANESLSQRVYDVLLERIFDNQLTAGEMINRREVAAELGISVAPVLEAMLMLERDGLLETLPRKGTRVTVIRSSDVAGHLFVREALECHVARHICGPTVIKAQADLLPLAIHADQVPLQSHEYSKADFAFHSTLVGLCGCDLMSDEYERIFRLGFFYWINQFIPVDQGYVRQNHVELLENLKKDDPDYAHSIMRAHITSGKGDLVISRDLRS